MTGARWRLIAAVALLVAAVAGLVVATRGWWTIHTEGADIPMSGSTSSGGLATVLALVVGGALPLILILRPIGRRIVGVVVGLAGAGMVLTGALATEPGTEQIRTELRQHTLAEATGITMTGWPIGYLVAGLVAIAAAVIVVVTASWWPVRGDRFDRRRVTVNTHDPQEVWKALDAGIDPTAEHTDTTPDR